MISHTQAKVVVFLDSGVGGLPYLRRSRELLPRACLHYLADDAGFPYGTKKPSEVEAILLDRTRRLRALLLPDLMVIACNTASQIGLKTLRSANPDLPIIGTVPAIKPAAEESPTGRIAVMATQRTIEDPYLDDLIARYASETSVLKLPAQDLVSFVERRYLDSDTQERRIAVEPYVRRLIDQKIDRVILACTHFLYLQDDISACAAALGATRLKIVDSLEGVANRVKQLLPQNGETGIEAASLPPKGRFLLSSDPPFDPSYYRWASSFGLGPPERL